MWEGRWGGEVSRVHVSVGGGRREIEETRTCWVNGEGVMG